MPFLQEQKTVTGAGLSRYLEHENTGYNLCFYEQCDALLLFVAFSNELDSLAHLTGDS